MTVVCGRCNEVVGGGHGSLHGHHKSRRCQRAVARRQERESRTSAQEERCPVINPVAYQELEAVFPADYYDNLPEAGPGNDLDIPDHSEISEEVDLPVPECHQFEGPGPTGRSANRFATIRRIAASRSTCLVVGEDGKELSDDDLVDIPTSGDELAPPSVDMATKYQEIITCLMGLVAPPDHVGSGLSRSNRAKVFSLVDACLRLSKNADGLPPPRTVDLLQMFSPHETSSLDEDRLLLAYMDGLCNDDGWVEREISVRTGHSATARWNQKINEALVEVVCDHWDHIQRHSKYDGETFGHPTTGIHMYEFENIVHKQQDIMRKWNSERDFVLLLVLFSDGTLLANKGSLTAHPVTISVGNLPPQLCASSQILLGYIGEFSKTSFASGNQNQSTSMKQAQHADIRRALMAAQTKEMVEPLVIASYEGIEFKDPSGTARRMFPTLFSAPLDHPEVCSHLGHKSTYCGICYWKAGLSHSVWRSEAKSRKFVEDVNIAPRSRIQGLKDTHGAHGQPSGLWGFNGSCPTDCLPKGLSSTTREAVMLAGSTSPWTDVQVAVSGEVMHEIDLGLLVYTKNAILRHMRDDLCMNDHDIEDVNEGLRLAMTSESRVQGLSHPPTKKITGVLQGYFGGSSRIEAKEHRAVLQFMVPVLVRFLGEKDAATRLAALVVKYYKQRQRHLLLPVGENGHTEESLENVAFLFEKINQRLNDLEPTPSDDVTPKLHQQTHFKMQVMRMGNTSITSGQAGEANNTRIKGGFRQGRTNQQKDSVIGTLVRLHRHNSASARAYTTAGLEKDASSRRKKTRSNYETSLVIALRTDRCSFSKHRNVSGQDVFTTVDVYNWVTYHVGSVAVPRELSKWDETVSDTRRNLLNSPRKFQRLEEAPRVFATHKRLEMLLGDTSVADALLDELFFFFCGQDSTSARKGGLCLTLKVVRSATNPSVIHGDRNVSTIRLVQRIRANRNFMGRMWHDFVAISSGDQPDMGDSAWYARLILLFHVRDQETGEWVEMAFVRYMKRIETLEEHQKRLSSSDDEPDVTKMRYAQRVKKGQRQWYFGVILAESILRKVHVVAGNSEASQSLLHSVGERKWFEDEKRARFLMNNAVWETDKFEPYRFSVDSSVEVAPID